MEGDTASLRNAAPNWSLAGDKQLLGVLQKIHQTILTKCEEANVKLDAMVDALDNASIDLQNVNNKFMALSNSQFVESRVYEDDVDTTTEGTVLKTEPQKVELESEITKLKHSLQRLEQMHEPVHILDSDSSDDEDEGRIILKPKDTYTHRPLPYIIGSQAWKSKWHAGLLQEESDSDSSLSKRDNIPAEEYSESEPETAPTDKLANRTISSSSIESELTPQPQPSSQVTAAAAKPADIAAELARRLGGQPVQLPENERVAIESPPEPATKKVYRVEKPAPTTIFSDEPPPLDDYQSYKSDYTDDDDIFAELHKKPYPNVKKDQNRGSKDLFGGLNDNIVDQLFGEEEIRDTDIGNVIDYQDVEPSGRRISPIFGDTVAEKLVPKLKTTETKRETETVKKPVGGISLFGNNKGAESIGAAILKRNQRKSSSSDEEISSATENKRKLAGTEKTKEEPVNKIIEDLFSKPAKKGIKKEDKIREEEPKKVKPVKDKVDLFSDNLFDDIDDIFTTNIVTKPNDNKNQKSIFDDDDLFADVTLKKSEKSNNKTETENIFDGNDDLFSESKKILPTSANIKNNPINVHKDMLAEEKDTLNVKRDKRVKKAVSTSLLDDSSEDDLFVDNQSVNKIARSQKSTTEAVEKVNSNVITIEDKSPSIETISNDVDKPSLNKNLQHKNNNSGEKKLLIKVSSKSKLESPSVFDEDEFDDLFNAKRKVTVEDSNLNNVEGNNYINEKVGNDQNAESMKENKFIDLQTAHKEVKPQTLDIVAETRHSKEDKNTQLENEVMESYDILVKNDVMPEKSNINSTTDDKRSPKNFQPVETLATSVQQVTDDIRPPPLKNSKKDKEPKQPKTSNEEKVIPPPHTTIPDTATPESNETSIFSDIFIDMPPAFEKPLEPKKSKNVNALFDDDSDDEASFFKKSEGISDEKPDLNYSNDRFRIFHDEPPEIEVDFSQKPSKNNLSSFSGESDDELFNDLPDLHKQDTVKNDLNDSIKEVNKSHDSINFGENNVIDITKLIEDSKKTVEKREIDDSKFVEVSEGNNQIGTVIEDKNITNIDVHDGKENNGINETETLVNIDPIEENEQKKSIGKLKPVNLNINVNSLLPGASLKKSKTNEETDGQTISSKSNEELNIHSPGRSETKMVKSVSFDGDPESKVLDNKLSKQRAKIQVKRRPSSRRARLEAVRKSGIDFASDSTDNSSSFDEPPSKEIVNKETQAIVNKSDSISTQQKVISTETVKENTSSVDIISINRSPFTKTLQKPIDNAVDTKTEVKSKVVYILNDEDIFTDINPRKAASDENKGNKNVLNFVEDDDEFLFKTPNISTLGKAYENKAVSRLNVVKTEPETSISKQNVQKNRKLAKEKFSNTKKSLFNDLSDDDSELFGSKKPAVQKSHNIFDSDSEGELFTTSKKESKATFVPKKEAVRGSLFGDESDDENDLFEVRKTSGDRRQTPVPKKPATKTSEPVFEDPLSMFGDDS